MLYYATTNSGKFAEAQLILAPRQLEQCKLDIPEIQGSPEEIVRHKAIQACNHLGSTVVVEDVTLKLQALNGFPGPYCKDFLTAVGEEGLWQLAERFQQHQVSTECWVGYARPGEEVAVFVAECRGTIVAPRGNLRHGKVSYNLVFQPEGFDQTFGEMSMAEHAKISHRTRALQKLAAYLG